MSNLFKQVNGEWVKLSEKEEERVWSARGNGAIDAIRSLLRRIS